MCLPGVSLHVWFNICVASALCVFLCAYLCLSMSLSVCLCIFLYVDVSLWIFFGAFFFCLSFPSAYLCTSVLPFVYCLCVSLWMCSISFYGCVFPWLYVFVFVSLSLCVFTVCPSVSLHAVFSQCSFIFFCLWEPLFVCLILCILFAWHS